MVRALWGVRELADHLGASRSTVNRAAAGSDRAGSGHARPVGAYTVGPRLRVLTHALFRRTPPSVGARDIIGRLGDSLRRHRDGRAAKCPTGNGFHRPGA